MTKYIDETEFKINDWVILKSYKGVLPYGLNEKDIYPVKVVSIDYIDTQIGPEQFGKKCSVSTNDRGEMFTIRCCMYRLATENEAKKEKMRDIFRAK
jgi:hypothetical protein